MQTLNLTRFSSGKLDGNGNGTVALGPDHPGEVWLPQSVSIGCTGAIPATGTPTFYLYSGNAALQQYFVDATYNVTGGSSSMISGQQLFPGQQVFGVWSGGPPNGVASMTISGTRKVP